MGKVLNRERMGNRIQTDILNSDGTLTVHTYEDVEPVFDKVKILAENKHNDFKFKAAIPLNMVDEACKIKGAEWGISKADAYRELILNKSRRAQKVWKVLTSDSDYRKLQARHH